MLQNVVEEVYEMNRKGFCFLVLLCGVLLVGCVPLVVATVAGVAVHAVGEDALEVVLDAPFDKVWETSVSVVTSGGNVKIADKDNAKIEAVVGSSNVEIKLHIQSLKTTRVRVRSRKLYGVSPDIKTANSILVKIIERVKK